MRLHKRWVALYGKDMMVKKNYKIYFEKRIDKGIESLQKFIEHKKVDKRDGTRCNYCPMKPKHMIIHLMQEHPTRLYKSEIW